MTLHPGWFKSMAFLCGYFKVKQSTFSNNALLALVNLPVKGNKQKKRLDNTFLIGENYKEKEVKERLKY